MTAIPYYYLYARDLRFAGYRGRDLFGVYALNLMLVLVSLAGVLRSLQQVLTGRKSAFGRTPKVDTRTITPPFYIASYTLMLCYLALQCAVDLGHSYYSHGAFSFLTFVFVYYGVSRFIGWRECYADLRQQCDALLRSKEERATVQNIPTPASIADRAAA
jgi:hypothetical protein